MTLARGVDLALRGRPRRLVPLVLGFEALEESISIAGGSRFRHLLEPVTAAAVVFDQGWVLIDGGFDPARIRDRQRRREAYDYENYAPIVPHDDPLTEQIAEAGLAWRDLAAAALSHAHFDHTGAIRMLTDGQPLLIQEREWDHVRRVVDARHSFLFVEDIVRDDVQTILLHGDTELADGLTALATPGHTPGHQSFVIELPDRSVVLACDAADLRANIDTGAPCGSTVGSNGPASALASLERLRELDRLPDTEVWPGHDPKWGPWRAVVDRVSARRHTGTHEPTHHHPGRRGSAATSKGNTTCP